MTLLKQFFFPPHGTQLINFPFSSCCWFNSPVLCPCATFSLSRSDLAPSKQWFHQWSLLISHSWLNTKPEELVCVRSPWHPVVSCAHTGTIKICVHSYYMAYALMQLQPKLGQSTYRCTWVCSVDLQVCRLCVNTIGWSVASCRGSAWSGRLSLEVTEPREVISG